MAVLEKRVAPEKLVSDSLVVTHVFVLGTVSHPKIPYGFGGIASAFSPWEKVRLTCVEHDSSERHESI